MLVSLLLATIGKFGISLFYSILITKTAELYPTCVRSIGYGISIITGNVGTIFMPAMVAYMQFKGINPIIIFGLISILAFYIVQNLPETFGQEMNEDIFEIIKKKASLFELQEIRNG